MTLDEFFERLKATPRQWVLSELNGRRMLRLALTLRGVAPCSGGLCPLQAVTKCKYDRPGDSGVESWDRVAIAADDYELGYRDAKNAAMRTRLLEACGVKEAA